MRELTRRKHGESRALSEPAEILEHGLDPEPEPSQGTPERRLLIAVLAVALSDKDSAWIEYSGPPRKGRLTFPAVCEGLDLNANAIRRALRRRWPKRQEVLTASMWD